MTRSFEQAIADFAPALPLAVAYSGGADSTALLLACARQWPGQVSAVHAHHGLQAAGDDFERHCRSFCSDLNVPLVVQKVDARHAPGQSPEAAARQARYQAIDALALHGQLAIQTIAIAQHADDQVETLLLALSRGAGLPGLSAMAAQWQRGGLTYCRPLLQVSGEDIRDWLHAQGATKVGCVGFCLGGRLAYMAAARTDVNASVGYYGVMIDQMLNESHAIAHPLMLHIPTADHLVGPEAQTKMHEGLDPHPKVTLHDYEGLDHGFAATGGNRRDEAGAQLADGRTKAFLAEHLA